MKICPTCSQTYTDDTLNFCLTDGAVLKSDEGGDGAQPTVFMGKAPQTSPNQPFGNQSQSPTTSFGNQSQAPPVSFGSPVNQSNWGAAQPGKVLPAPRPKSRAWVWILGIVFGVLLVGVVGVVGLVVLVAIGSDHDKPGTNISTNNPGSSAVLKEDFSNWKTEDGAYGKTEYKNGEYFMSSKQTGLYYVLITGKKDYKTTNATTKLTARNVNAAPTTIGYGLLVHSNPTVALASDYVFLIDSTKQSYRIATHTANKESSVIPWTRFSAIHPGTQANEIEVKDENGKMTLSINGEVATTVNNSTINKDGIVGVYAGDAIPVAFSNLQLAR